MKFGKNIKLYLLDGDANGRWICELSNWTGKAYKIPRNYYKECQERKELITSGVYFLFGYNEEESTNLIYIGETENILERLKQHINDSSKEYWNEAVVFISKDDYLNKAHIKYLENRFYEIAKCVNRYKVMNDKVPTRSNVSEAEQAELEEFIYNAKILVPILGHKVFDSVSEGKSDNNEKDYLYINNNKGVSAIGMVTSDGFVVLKGSKISDRVSKNSLRDGVINLRNKHITDGKVKEYILVEDILFSSSSTAAEFILGNSVSGPKTWKNKDNKTLKEIESEI